MIKYLITLLLVLSSAISYAQSFAAELQGIAVTDLGSGLYRVSGNYVDPTNATTGTALAVGDFLVTPALVLGDTCRFMEIDLIYTGLSGFVDIRVNSNGQGAPLTQSSLLVSTGEGLNLLYPPATSLKKLDECVSRYFSSKLEEIPEKMRGSNMVLVGTKLEADTNKLATFYKVDQEIRRYAPVTKKFTATAVSSSYALPTQVDTLFPIVVIMNTLTQGVDNTPIGTSNVYLNGSTLFWRYTPYQIGDNLIIRYTIK